MDTPALVILLSFAILLGLVPTLRVLRVPRMRRLAILSVAAMMLWAVMTTLGESVFGWGMNASCSPYLGCVPGFFGYDAFEHLMFGIAMALVIVWLCERYPGYSILHTQRWKSALVVVALVVFVAVLWEIAECAHDVFRLDILHQPLRNFRLNIDLLDQPTNIDTMGDLIFSLVGAVIGFFLALPPLASSQADVRHEGRVV